MLRLMFLPFGRANRPAFLAGLGATWLLLPLLSIPLTYLAMSRIIPPGSTFLFFVPAIIVLWVGFCLSANRLHDLGRSALWAVAPLLLLMLGAGALTGFRGGESTAMVVGLSLLYVAPVLYIAFAAFLLLFKGSDAPNRFGERPELA